MQEWILQEAATADFSDERLDRRFRIVLDTMSEKPSLKFPAGCNGRKEMEAAYRFLDNDKVEKEKVFAPHLSATLERILRGKGCADSSGHDRTRRHSA